MEKIKFGSAIYDLVPAGTHYGISDQLRLTIVWPEGITYEDIENSLTGCDRIEILSEVEELLEATTGYTCLASLRKEYDRVIGIERVQDGQNDAGEPLYINQEVRGAVAVASLKRPDVRAQLEQLAEELTATQLAVVEIYEGKAV